MRARAGGGSVVALDTKKASELLAKYLPKAAQALISGLSATKIAWNNEAQAFVDSGLPDHKERRESARAIWEYVIGKPIERSMEVTGSYKELSQVLAELRQSPEACRLLSPELFDTLQSAAESKESPPNPDSEKKPES